MSNRPPGYFDNFLHEFHRRQRDELLRQPLWRICLQRAQDFMFRLNVPSLASYPAAVTAVLVCAAVISLKVYQGPGTQNVAAQNQTPVVATAFKIRPGVFLLRSRRVIWVRSSCAMPITAPTLTGPRRLRATFSIVRQ